MRRHFFLNFIVGYIIFGVASFLIISIVTSKMTYNHMLNEEAEAMYRQANNIATQDLTISFVSSGGPSQSLNNQLATIDRYLGSEVMLINADGGILLDTTGRYGIIEEFDPAINDDSFYFIGDFFGMFSEETLSVMAPIIDNYTLKGYVLLHQNTSVIYQNADAVFNYNYFSMIIMLVLAAIFIGTFIINLYFPIKKLANAISYYAAGDFSKRVRLKRRDEIGQLANSLDYMAGEIEKLNNYQSKFIANISHDFRSPLTSIKGYLEAMLDGTIPPEMQEKYLNIVLFETERLNKLTSNLLSLNNMNQGMLLETGTFDINGIIKKTILTFEGVCTQKRIKFDLIFSAKNAYVTADLGKIQQVIYNLIDNAIKFSNNNSTIKISTSEKSEKIFISVKDYGIGIPKDSLDKIWDRFYKSDLSRGKDKKGTGLGLSIVKEIINAHKTTIDVISTEGTGTEFIFSLPKGKRVE